MSAQYSELSLNITKSVSKSEKKEFGIFITPRTIIEQLVKQVLTYIAPNSITKILEPSCGTCEIINYCDSVFENVIIDGIEYNDTIYQHIKNMKFKNIVLLTHCDFMEFNAITNYDLIIGNPPYFVCKKTDMPSKYHSFCVGRPNIFGLFIIHSLSLLKTGGVLAFVIPKSFLNSLYYAPIRNYIKETCQILDIIDFGKVNEFIDTDQATFGLIIQKYTAPIISDCKFSLKLNSGFIFATDTLKLKQLLESSTTLEKMGLKVRTGQIVWNEHKEELTDNKDDTLLIYNTNISKDNKLEIKKFKNDAKGQYIKLDGRIDPILLVNRGNGNSAYKLNYAILTNEGPYLIENHLNEIYSPTNMSKEELLTIYEKITNSFKNTKTQQFIELFLGNNGLSKTELESIFPIYL